MYCFNAGAVPLQISARQVENFDKKLYRDLKTKTNILI